MRDPDPNAYLSRKALLDCCWHGKELQQVWKMRLHAPIFVTQFQAHWNMTAWQQLLHWSAGDADIFMQALRLRHA